ncbi:class I SAM-dependent methyltransferase [Candidatus Pelagibacter sp. HIMB1495]|uniref:class I SAM-dependent methyltransferase n=1 Tax=unclassified Candidatus Pelagibacter TaxID=2647897 RepID=UPI003F84B89B
MENLNIFKLIFNRLYYFIFVERFFKKLKIDFPKDIYRWHLIQHLIDKYSFENYLEIGCDKDQSFSKIKIKNKVGVDPVSGGTIRDTSDNFFKSNTQKFDLIFIDGLHHYDQVIRDIYNSLKIIKENGYVLIHDCLPRSIAHQAVPRYRGSWNGDVWKSIVEMRTNPNFDTFTCKIDYGVGIIFNRKNTDILKLDTSNFQNLKFRDYYKKHHVFMRVIEYKKLLEII